jgi:hypothetical protein
MFKKAKIQEEIVLGCAAIAFMAILMLASYLDSAAARRAKH